MGFLGGIFSGSAPGLSQSENTAGSLTSFGTGLGTSDVGAASNFWRTILGGDQQAISKLLAPEISTIQGQGQQQIQNESQFGNRSGGTNASNQQNIDTQRQNVERMIAGLTGQAASQVGQLGEFGINTALEGNQQRASDAEQKLQNQKDSLFSTILSSGIGAAESAGLGALGI